MSGFLSTWAGLLSNRVGLLSNWAGLLSNGVGLFSGERVLENMAAPFFEQLLKFIAHGRIFESLRYYTEGLEQCLLRSSQLCVTCWSVLATRIKKSSGQHTKKYFKSWSRNLKELWVTKMWAIKVWLIFEPLLNQGIKSFRMKWSSDQGQLWQHTSDYPFCLTSNMTVYTYQIHPFLMVYIMSQC